MKVGAFFCFKEKNSYFGNDGIVFSILYAYALVKIENEVFLETEWF